MNDPLGLNGNFISAGLNTTTKKKKNFWEDNISTGGSLAGALGGAAAGTAILPGVGTLIGGVLGGIAGGAGGQLAENAVVGDNLGTDVASEALWGGATALPFGAIGKLGKAGFTVAKGLGSEAARTAAKDLVSQAAVKTMPTRTLAGALQNGTLSDSMQKAATDALAKNTVRQTAANKLGGVANDLAVKQFRLTPSQLANYNKKFGEDAGQTIRKYGFTSAEDIASKGIDPLQQQFTGLVSNVGSISKDTLKNNFDTAISKLANSNSSTNRAIGQQLQGEVDQLLSKYGKDIPANKVNDIRREFDSLVNYTNQVADPNKYGVNKRVADVLRKTLQEADSTGQLKNVGQEISKLRQLSDNVLKQSELGRGSLPLSLTQLLSSGAGGVVGGVPGALAGAAVSSAVNSQAGRRALMGVADKAVNTLSNTGKKELGQTLKQAATRIGGIDITRGLINGQSSDLNMAGNTTNAQNTTNAPANTAPMNSNMSSQYTDNSQMSNPTGYSSGQLYSALMQAYAANDIPTAKMLENMYQLASDYESSQAKAGTANGLNSTAAGVVADTQTGLRALDELQGSINSSGANSPFIGDLRALNPYDTEAQNLQAQVATAKQIVGKALEGGVLRKEDEVKYAKLLPTMGDSDAVAQFKIQQLQALISSRLQDYLSSMGSGGGGYDTNSLAAALGR